MLNNQRVLFAACHRTMFWSSWCNPWFQPRTDSRYSFRWQWPHVRQYPITGNIGILHVPLEIDTELQETDFEDDSSKWHVQVGTEHTNVEVEVRLLKGGQTKKQVQPMKRHLHNIWEYQGIKLHSCINTWPVCSVFWQPEPIIIYLLIWLCVKTHPNTSRNHKHSARTIIVFV